MISGVTVSETVSESVKWRSSVSSQFHRETVTNRMKKSKRGVFMKQTADKVYRADRYKESKNRQRGVCVSEMKSRKEIHHKKWDDVFLQILYLSMSPPQNICVPLHPFNLSVIGGKYFYYRLTNRSLL